MSIFGRLAELSVLPIVDLADIRCPQDGAFVALPQDCRTNFARSDKCQKHYEEIASASALNLHLVQCPYGFATMPIRTPTKHIAISGFIPYPRLGGDRERACAKKFPQNKIAMDAIQKSAAVLKDVEMKLVELEQETIKRHAVALHEIRKLNRNVKQSAERLCRRQNSVDPEMADVELVNIWKSAEIMSTQFDVIELVANEDLAILPLNSNIDVYRIFDKCTRIYRPRDNPARISINSPFGFKGQIRACDKTFPMIPTVLIENALKYSPNDTEVRVRFESLSKRCRVKVSNVGDPNVKLGPEIYLKGYRGTDKIEGSGNGLHVAQLVANQHNSVIRAEVLQRGGLAICEFSVEFEQA